MKNFDTLLDKIGFLNDLDVRVRNRGDYTMVQELLDKNSKPVEEEPKNILNPGIGQSKSRFNDIIHCLETHVECSGYCGKPTESVKEDLCNSCGVSLGQEHKKTCELMNCDHCGLDKRLKGTKLCDHFHYPESCEVCSKPTKSLEVPEKIVILTAPSLENEINLNRQINKILDYLKEKEDER